MVFVMAESHQAHPRHLYTIRRNCALWQVVSKQSGKVIFSSLSKANCVDWLEVNYSDNESEK